MVMQRTTPILSYGETDKIARDLTPEATRTYAKLSQGYLTHNSMFRTRNGFKYLTKVQESNSTAPSPRLWFYRSNRAFLIQFSTKVSERAYEVKYSIINTDDGTIIKDRLGFITTGSTFDPIGFDLLFRRKSSSTDGVIAWIVGGSDLFIMLIAANDTVTFSNDWSYNSSDDVLNPEYQYVTYDHPVCITDYGTAQAFFMWRMKEVGTIKPAVKSTINENSLDGTSLRLFFKDIAIVYRSNASSLGITLEISLKSNEKVKRQAFFFDTLFIISNLGLRTVVLGEDLPTTGVGKGSKFVSAFNGANVTPRILQGTSLLYCGDEIRIRDSVTSTEGNIKIAGDKKALSLDFERNFIAMVNHPNEDTLLFLDDEGVISAVGIIFIGIDSGVPIYARSKTTFFEPATHKPIAIANLDTRLGYVTQEDGFDNLYLYDKTTSGDTLEDGSVVTFTNTLTLSKWALVTNITRLRIFLRAVNGGQITAVTGDRILFEKDGNFVLALNGSTSDTYFSGSLSVSYSSDLPMELLSCLFSYTTKSLGD